MEAEDFKKIAELTSYLGNALTEVTGERDTLLAQNHAMAQKLAAYDVRAESEKIAEAMRDNGLLRGDFRATVEQLCTKTAEERRAFAVAAQIHPADLQQKIASGLHDPNFAATSGSRGAAAAFESFLLGTR